MLAKRYAAVIGIDRYGDGIAPLQSAVADAREVAAALEGDHGYVSPHVLLDGAATGAAILRLLEETLPAAAGGAECSVVLYYAGHGIALGDGREGPEGFLLPQDAQPGDEGTWLSMERVRQALSRLSCRHLLVVLDCCFAGSFRWAASRSFVPVGRPLYDSQYARFLAGTAWQVLTSASHQEKALDVAPGSRNTRGGDGASHSPFAAALLRGLAGQADSTRGDYEPDGVMTATELHQFIFEELVPPGARPRQTPGLWPLKPDNTGEFLFGVPGRQTRTRPDPPLDDANNPDANNPWLGLRAYGRKDAPLFFGRERVVEEVLGRLLDPARPPLLAVVGASGTGKSSVVRAGVLPRIGEWAVARMPRLQGDPRLQLGQALASFTGASAGQRRLLFIDQFEELFTQCPDGLAREGFLRQLRELMSGESPVHVVLTLRSDFEPRLAAAEEIGPLLAAGRYLVPAMTSEDFRAVIEEPAKLKALYFEPEALVGELVDEVQAMPGGLPLLSFALAETYRQAQLRRRATGALDRALTRGDFASAGGVVGALHRRADELYEAADPERRETIRRVFLRMVSYEGGRLARRRVEERELEYGGTEEPARVRQVLEDYVQARLLVADGGWIEPAHDTLVLAWDKLLGWSAERGSQELARQLWSAASAWDAARREKGDQRAVGLLWNQDPRLPLGPARRDLNEIEREFTDKSVARKRNRRNLAVGITAAVVLALSGLTVYAFNRARAFEDQRNRALDVARVSVAGEWLPKDPTLAALALLEVQKPDETPYTVVRLREALKARLADSVLSGHEDFIESVSLSADGKRLVTASDDGTAMVWPLHGSAEPLKLNGHEDAVYQASFSPDGKRIVTASGDKTARIWPADGSGKSVVLRGHEQDVSDAAFSPDGRLVVTASWDGTARVWPADGAGPSIVLSSDKETPSEEMTTERYLNSVAFSPDGKSVVTASNDKTSRVWPADGSGPPVVLRGHQGPVLKAVFSPDGKRVLTVSEDKTARVWSARGSGQPLVLRGHQRDVLSAAFSPDGRRILTASYDGTARLWPVDSSGQPIIFPHEGGALSAGFSSDGRFVVTSSEDGTVRVWQADGSRTPMILHQEEAVSRALFNPDGSFLVTASDLSARIWPVGNFVEPLTFPGSGKKITFATVSFSLDRSRVVTYDGTTALVWPTNGSGKPVVLQGQGDSVPSAALSPDGKRVVITSRDEARIWPTDGFGKPIVLRGHEADLASAAFSFDGKLVVTTSFDDTVRIWRADGSGKPVVLRGHKNSVWCAAFSPDGQRIVTGSSDKTARIWEADGSGVPVILQGHLGPVESAVFSPDGTLVATGSGDGTARVWKVDGSGEPRVFQHETEESVRVSFSPDGSRIMTTSDDGTALIWRVDGLGEPVRLQDLREAVFSADGHRVLSVSLDTTEVQVWAVSGILLQALVRTATSACLDPEFRVRSLGETEPEAQATYARCQRCVAPWRRRWDPRAVRAAPDKAWSEWQACMGGAF